jgi:hypothetical protein
MENIEIQLLDQTGNWRTFGITPNQSPLIIQAMRQLQWQFPEARVRAIDGNGSIVNIM